MPRAVPITVNVGEPHLADVLSTLNEDLARSNQRPLSVSIVNNPSNERDRWARRITENLAVHAALRLLRLDFGRVQTLVINTDLRSSLRGVVEHVQGQNHGSLVQLSMSYENDDLLSPLT